LEPGVGDSDTSESEDDDDDDNREKTVETGKYVRIPL
jgi:hypothetical protein